MADVRPFRGIHYNNSLLHDWAKVICPVYDIIPPGDHEKYYSMSPYNFVRLEAGRVLPQDTSSDNKYTRAAATLDEWLNHSILERDALPAIYMHDHYFTFAGINHRRRAIIARVKLEEWDKMVVRPHESTFAEARSDRLSLLWAIRANTSSILSMFEDPAGEISRLLSEQESQRPLMDLPMAGGEGHRVWALSDPKVAGKIGALLGGLPIYIADGHHRYESALAFRRQQRAVSSSAAEQPFDFVMMTLVAFDEPGLLILPPHRLIRGVPKATLEELHRRLEVFFTMTELDCSTEEAWQEVDSLRKSSDKPRLVMFGPDGNSNRLLVLEPKDMSAFAPMMPHFRSDLYKRLEVSIIDHVILEKLLALDHEKDGVNLGYSYDRNDAVDRVRNGQYQLAFLLEPISPQTIKAIADISDKMPKKSTYFYPKVPAGLLINRLV